jgi:uncharacterized repeat protein (TIGR01451 family)
MFTTVLFALGAGEVARAAGTSAGTSIQSTAQVTYSLTSGQQSTSSNTVTLVVAEILDVVVTTAVTRSVSPGAAQQALLFSVTNTGNGTESFSLTASSAGIPGDDFDPQLASTSLYFDSDDSNDLSAADVPYVPGGNDPQLAADASVRVLVVNDMPASLSDAARGRSQLSAAARTGTGAAGTLFAGQGDGGLDAIAGISGGDGEQIGEYVANGVQIAAVKSQTIADLSGGARALSGARIEYRIVVNVSGSGAAPDALFSDSIPTNTTYVPGSLQLNGTMLSDSADTDVGELATAPTPQVRVQLGDLSQASGPQTISFAVTIN